MPTKPNRPMLIAMAIVFSLRPGDRPGLPARAHRPLGEGARARHPRPDAAAAGRGPADPPDGADAARAAPLDARRARLARGRRLSQRPGQPAGRRRPARADRTLLVTSAKAGEGKSTTALNLAATCALAGERTLLLDVDLRRPSLAEVFVEDEDSKIGAGRGRRPPRRAPLAADAPPHRIANLDFIPTGDTRDTPIEILGTLELRQFLLALSHHYDRVILDGPAVLGLADCRFLGRIVDASLLVVRSGSHHLMTLHRAKAMLEQSHVAIAGVVFNGLTEDMENWSSYGYGDALRRPPIGSRPARAEEALSSPASIASNGRTPWPRRPALIDLRRPREMPIMNLRQKIMVATDRLLAVALVVLVLGSVLASAVRSGGSRRRSSGSRS